MRRGLLVPVLAFVLFVAAGCDPADLPSGAKAVLMAQGVGSVAAGDPLMTQQRLRLMDGSCAGDGNRHQYQYAGAATGNGVNGAAGEGGGDRLRLRDGSCGDGGGG